jgi:hypothetical protein
VRRLDKAPNKSAVRADLLGFPASAQLRRNVADSQIGVVSSRRHPGLDGQKLPKK